IISLGKTCKQCDALMIQINRVGARPYRMCIDPKCPSKVNWGKKKHEAATIKKSKTQNES
ncbi:MAG: hypothetical protein OEX16_06265, partial [Hadesarchaea archaeon]|nr:hypothetical protein [Hadesarchaea archaeon]